MTWAERAKTGFRRIGVSCAALILLVGLATLLIGAYRWASPLVDPPKIEISHPAGFTIAARFGDDLKDVGGKAKAAATAASLSKDELYRLIEQLDAQIERVHQSRADGADIMLGSSIAVPLAGLAFSFWWMIGWIAAGFLGDRPK